MFAEAKVSSAAVLCIGDAMANTCSRGVLFNMFLGWEVNEAEPVSKHFCSVITVSSPCILYLEGIGLSLSKRGLFFLSCYVIKGASRVGRALLPAEQVRERAGKKRLLLLLFACLFRFLLYAPWIW